MLKKRKEIVIMKKHQHLITPNLQNGVKNSRQEFKKRMNAKSDQNPAMEIAQAETEHSEETTMLVPEIAPSVKEFGFDDFIGNLSGERLGRIRKEIYADCGFSFPFSFDPNTLSFNMQIKSWQSILKDDKMKPKKIDLTLGQQCFADSKALVTVKKIEKETSQGQVSVVELRDQHEKSLFVVLKADEILKSNNVWTFDQTTKRTIHGEKGHEKYHVTGAGFMDAFCCQFLSNRVEKQELPNFPLVYATSITQIENSYSQLLFMEYLPHSLFEVLKNEKDARIWWSSFFQIIFALAFVGSNYGFQHNDFHAENVRVRVIDPQLYGNYIFIDATGKEYCFRVPYYGACCCIIDCGRSVIKPFGMDKMGLISSEFLNGNCVGLIPDNSSFDLVRLTASLYAYTDRIQPPEDRTTIQNFIKSICKSDNEKIDYIKGFDGYSKMSATEKYNWMETMPRQLMHNALPAKLLPKFVSLYGCLKKELKQPIFSLTTVK